MITLSSRYTFIPKFILPITLLTFLFFSAYQGIALYGINSLFNVGTIFFCFFAFFTIKYYLSLKVIQYNSDELIVSNFITVERFPLSDVVGIRRNIISTFTMTITNGDNIKKIKFIVPQRETFENPTGLTPSLRLFETMIKEKKHST